jgi:predicted RNase H-like HicB family nuclease
MFIPYSDEKYCMGTGREIRLIEEDDGWWSAIDEQTAVASQGPTRSEALENLDEAVSVTNDARNDDTPAPEPDAPWFEG